MLPLSNEYWACSRPIKPIILRSPGKHLYQQDQNKSFILKDSFTKTLYVWLEVFPTVGIRLEEWWPSLILQVRR